MSEPRGMISYNGAEEKLVHYSSGHGSSDSEEKRGLQVDCNQKHGHGQLPR